MKNVGLSLLACAAVALSGCSETLVVEVEEVKSAIEDKRYRDAQAALISERENAGASPRNSQMLAEVAVALGDGYTAERYLSDLEDDSDAGITALRAHAYILQGRPHSARMLIEGFEGERAEDDEFDWLLVWAAMEEGEIETAEALVHDALLRFPQSAKLHAKAARLSLWRDNPDAAARHLGEALQNEPYNYEALLLKGEGEIAAGAPDDALQTYREAAFLYPDFAVPKANIAGLLLDLGRLDEAGEQLDQALARHPEFALLGFNAARLQALRGDWARARDTMQALPAEWKRSFPAAALLEAEIEAALGNYAVARTLYMQLADDPRFAPQVDELMAALPEG